MNNLDDILVGKSETHLTTWGKSQRKIHKEALQNLKRFEESALQNGFQLELASSFRSFDRQLEIWNDKTAGTREILDDSGKPIDVTTLSRQQVLSSVLRWLALPGSSRHHWGTDFDVYDKAALSENYKIQLTLVESDTIFKNFHQWLDENMSQFGFFRPYAKDQGGVHREPWHLSYAPISQVYFERYSYELLEQTINESEIRLKDTILKHLPEVYSRFVRNITAP